MNTVPLRKLLITALAAALLAVPPPVPAQEKALSLEEAIRTALAAN